MKRYIHKLLCRFGYATHTVATDIRRCIICFSAPVDKGEFICGTCQLYIRSFRKEPTYKVTGKCPDCGCVL
jgi:hypothetical protein